MEIVTSVSADDLGRWRRQLVRILDGLDGKLVPNLGPSARIKRLSESGHVPRHIVAFMKVILELRNAAEYDAFEPSKAEGEAVRNAWMAVVDWINKKERAA